VEGIQGEVHTDGNDCTDPSRYRCSVRKEKSVDQQPGGIHLLGPVELRSTAGDLMELPGAKRRAVLALLALDFGRIVPVMRFFELLWGEQPPAQAKAALQGHVAALRKLLGDSLLTRSPGYQLTGDPDTVDALRFDALTIRAAGLTDDGAAAALLQEALNLWRGPALADLPDTELRDALRERLEESRIQAVTDWAERHLRLGSGSVTILALEQSVRANGLREPTIALLMRCLHQAGRQSDALAVYHRARVRLDDTLGITPGIALQEALADVLRGDSAETRASSTATRHAPDAGPATNEAPFLDHRIPRHTTGFVGRSLESHWLDNECGPARTGGGLAVVVGPAGSGKTATVVRWVRGVAAEFPDGLLFTDLRGFDPAGPGDPTEALGQFLWALGLPETDIPEDGETRAALYHQHTRDRRLLVVLDNVRSARDVTALIPSGTTCATIITSRNTLEDLVVTEGAAILRLDPLPSEDAYAMLAGLLNPDRVDAEPAAAERLIELCDRLPLTLRIAAARLASRPDWTLVDLVEELEDERTRLVALETQGAVSIRTALSLTYRHLPESAAHLFALMTVHPGAEVDLYSAAALLDADTCAARQALGSLAAYHLLTESTPGRYSRHDLIRLYGRELLTARGGDSFRQALSRLLDFYLVATRRAAQHLQPFVERVPPIEFDPRVLPTLVDVRSALNWFRVEEPVVRALVAFATDQGEHDRAWRLAELSNIMYHGAGQLTDRLSCLRAGLRAARLSGSREAIASLEMSTAAALAACGRAAEALPLMAQALARTGPADGNLHIRAVATQALVTAFAGDLETANRLSEQALDLIRSSGLTETAPAAFSNAAALKGMAGDATTALRYAREARARLADHPAATYQLSAMVNEAHALQILQKPVAAEKVWREVLELCRTAGTLQMHAMTESQFGSFLKESGRTEDAAGHWRTAIELYTRIGDHGLVEQLNKKLASIRSAATP